MVLFLLTFTPTLNLTLGAFGSSAATPTFGSTTGAFGQPAQQQSPQMGAFGQPAQQQQLGAFGQPAQPQMGMFGQPAQPPQAAVGTGTPPFNAPLEQTKSSGHNQQTQMEVMALDPAYPQQLILTPTLTLTLPRMITLSLTITTHPRSQAMQSITMMPQYADKSFEELRVEDLLKGQYGPGPAVGFGMNTRLLIGCTFFEEIIANCVKYLIHP